MSICELGTLSPSALAAHDALAENPSMAAPTAAFATSTVPRASASKATCDHSTALAAIPLAANPLAANPAAARPTAASSAVVAASAADLMNRWSRQLGRWRNYPFLPRPLAAIGYLPPAPAHDSLVRLHDLTFVVVHDEVLENGKVALRVAAYTGTRVPHGVSWGGPECCRFWKDLRMKPYTGAYGQRLDLARSELLDTALRLESAIQRCIAGSMRDRPQPLRQPKLWAAFRPADAVNVRPDGPEIETVAERRRMTTEAVLRASTRSCRNFVLFPLEFVSNQRTRMATVYADLRQFPVSQVILASNPATDLVGVCEPVSLFNFYDNDFRERFRLAGATMTVA